MESNLFYEDVLCGCKVQLRFGGHFATFVDSIINLSVPRIHDFLCTRALFLSKSKFFMIYVLVFTSIYITLFKIPINPRYLNM